MRLFLTIIISIVVLSSCKDDSEKQQKFTGIGTVENDGVFAIHYYDYTFYPTNIEASVKDNARVKFTLYTTYEWSEDKTFSAEVTELSDDLTLEIQTDELYATADSICVPNGMNITRDFRRNDYFDITTYYATSLGNTDFVCLVYDTLDQSSAIDTVTLWLRHYQVVPDSTASFFYEYNTFSSPLSGLQVDSLERVYIRLKYLSTRGDTTISNFTYSYYNEYVGLGK